MKILISQTSHGIGHQILDAWYAYRQHKLVNYKSELECTITNCLVEFDKRDYDLTILLTYLDKNVDFKLPLVKNYDLKLVCNGGEPLCVGNPNVKHFLENDSNAFLISNSYLSSNHYMSNKNLWFPHNFMTCRDYWTRHFYPQYFDNIQFQNLTRKNTIAVITGANRADRAYFFDMLSLEVPGLVNKSIYTQEVNKVLDSQWESDEDTQFKHYVNHLYQETTFNSSQSLYYDNSILVGLDNKFGSVPPGYFHLPLYYQNSCVIFPESNWQNNELAITEKSLKCFYSQALPFPISGAFVNQMYNELGFYTAWNLLPKNLQNFDNERSHLLRIEGTIDAIKWLYLNPEVFQRQEFMDYTQQNKIKFLDCSCDIVSIENFDNLIKETIKHERRH